MLTLIAGLGLALSKGPPSPEDRNRPSFRNVVFHSYLQFRKMVEVQNPVVPNCIQLASYPQSLYGSLSLPHLRVQRSCISKFPHWNSVRISNFSPFELYIQYIVISIYNLATIVTHSEI
jgi:hypothetical protein